LRASTADVCIHGDRRKPGGGAPGARFKARTSVRLLVARTWRSRLWISDALPWGSGLELRIVAEGLYLPVLADRAAGASGRRAVAVSSADGVPGWAHRGRLPPLIEREIRARI